MKLSAYLNHLQYCLFKIKLAVALFWFVVQLAVYKIIQLTKNFKILIFLYILLFIQALLVVFKAQEQTTPYSTQARERLTTAQKIVNFQQLETEPIIMSRPRLEEEWLQYQEQINNLAAIHQPTQSPEQIKHRDLLINLALLNLALDQPDQFEDLILQAKKIDPNWQGWRQ